MPQPTSLTLWQQYKLGDPGAFSRLYGAYVQVLYAQGMRVTPDAGLVKDCIHDLFVELWRDRQRVPQPESVPAYLAEALRTKLAAKLTAQNGAIPAEAPALLLHPSLPFGRNADPHRQPAGGWAVQQPMGRPEVMSLPCYGEVALPLPRLSRAFKALKGILSFR